MGLWNIWTALVAGLVIGGSIGTLLTAMLKASGAAEPPQPEVRKKTAGTIRVNALQGNDVTTLPDAIGGPVDRRVPLRFH